MVRALDEQLGTAPRAVQLGASFAERRVHLLELPADLEPLLAPGLRLRVLGGAHEADENAPPAVLCTQDATYAVLKAETSNMLLLSALSEGALADKHAGKLVVHASADHHLALRRVRPRVEGSLVAMLGGERALGFGSERVDEAAAVQSVLDGGIGARLSDLQAQVQASEAELIAALAALGAVRLGLGGDAVAFVALSDPLRTEVMDLVLASLVERGLAADDVQVAALADHLGGAYSAFVLRCALSAFSKAGGSAEAAAAAAAAAAAIDLDEAKISAFAAERLLVAAGPQGVAEVELLRDWSNRLPRGVKVDPTALRKLAVREDGDDSGGAQQRLRYFPASKLPAEAEACFRELFMAKARWKLEEMEPFLEHLLGPQVSKADLLKRFTRSVRQSLNSDQRVLVRR